MPGKPDPFSLPDLRQKSVGVFDAGTGNAEKGEPEFQALGMEFPQDPEHLQLALVGADRPHMQQFTQAAAAGLGRVEEHVRPHRVGDHPGPPRPGLHQITREA